MDDRNNDKIVNHTSFYLVFYSNNSIQNRISITKWLFMFLDFYASDIVDNFNYVIVVLNFFKLLVWFSYKKLVLYIYEYF
jgi:hypothetical protein